MESGEYPPYKASGMAYIDFARREKHLFRLLFMRNRSQEEVTRQLGDDAEPLLDLIQRAAGLSRESAGCSTWRCGSMSMASPPWRPRPFWTGTRS